MFPRLRVLMMKRVADISKFEGLQAVAHARMGIGSPLSVFNANINDEGPLNASNVIIPEEVLTDISEYTQDVKTPFDPFPEGDPSLKSAGKRLGAALAEQFGPGWQNDPSIVFAVRQALVDKAGSLAEAWAKNCILAERVESTFIPENADYARHRGDMDYVDVDALDPSFDLSDDEQYWAALEKANYPFMKFEEAAAHKKIEPPYGAEVRECAEQVYDAVLAAAMA